MPPGPLAPISVTASLSPLQRGACGHQSSRSSTNSSYLQIRLLQSSQTKPIKSICCQTLTTPKLYIRIIPRLKVCENYSLSSMESFCPKSRNTWEKICSPEMQPEVPLHTSLVLTGWSASHRPITT